MFDQRFFYYNLLQRQIFLHNLDLFCSYELEVGIAGNFLGFSPSVVNVRGIELV